jgi:peroxin-16
LRLSILLKTRRPLLAFPLPQREIDPSVLAQPETTSASTTPTTQPSAIPHLVSTLPPGTQPHTHLTPLLPRLPETYQPPAESLLPVISGWRETIGETMHASEGLVAVLVYALLARRRRAARQGTGMAALARDSLATSIIPLCWSLLARMLRRRAPRKSVDPMAQLMGMMGSPTSDTSGMTPLLAETYAARDRALLWNFVRGAIWQRWTRAKVMRLVGGLERVWGVRLVAGIVRDHVELVDEYYYCECPRHGK